MTKYIKNPKLKIRKETEGYVVYVPLRGSFWFNETAIDIFNLISDCDDAENIAAALMTEYDVSISENVKIEVEKTMNILQMIGCIKRVKD